MRYNAMHELPIIKTVLDMTLRYAEAHKALRVHKVVLVVGEMHDLVPEWIEKFYNYASKGTIAEGGTIEIETVPVICRCLSCRENYVFHVRGPEEEMRCPVCGSEAAERLSGDEFQLKEIVVS
jgi:hydrogenase nickel incorporation protein HypA/HybF